MVVIFTNTHTHSHTIIVAYFTIQDHRRGHGYWIISLFKAHLISTSWPSNPNLLGVWNGHMMLVMFKYGSLTISWEKNFTPVRGSLWAKSLPFKWSLWGLLHYHNTHLLISKMFAYVHWLLITHDSKNQRTNCWSDIICMTGGEMVVWSPVPFVVLNYQWE